MLGAVTDTLAVGTSGSLNSLVSQKWGRQNVKYDACCHSGPPQRPWCITPCLTQGKSAPERWEEAGFYTSPRILISCHCLFHWLLSD